MIIIYSGFTALCLCIGFYFGFKIGETKELPKMKRQKEEKVNKAKEDKETKMFYKSLRNLNRYDGTSNGQEEFE